MFKTQKCRRLLPALYFAAFFFALNGCSSTSFFLHANRNIAFMGDSITADWSLPDTNYGVPGEVTNQMLARFPNEVLGHGYATAVILGGTNDMRGADSIPEEHAAAATANIEKMASQAAAANMTVVLCSIPPILNRPGRAEVLNVDILKLANAKGYLYADYFTLLNNHPEYFKDDLHPNTAGYVEMQTALAKVISLK